jgi:SET family sugar efflux transporter-like MFS transporter
MSLAIWTRIIRTKFGLPVGLGILLQGALFAIVIPLLPIVITNKIGLDKLQVTLFFLINTLVGIVIMLGTGYLSDREGARYKIVLASGLVAALGYLGIATATLPIHAYVAGAAAVAFLVLFPQLFAVVKVGIVADWERESQVMGITALRTLFSFGFILGTALSSWLAGAVEIQSVFFGIAAAIIALTIYTAVLLYRIEQHIVRRTAHSAETAAVLSSQPSTIVLPGYALVVPLLALVVLRGADSTRGVYLPLVLFDLFHDASIAPLMFGITAAAELVTMGLMGYLSSKIGEKSTISIGAVFGALYYIILSSTQSLPLLYVAHVLYAVFIAALLGVAMAYVQNLLSHRVGMGGSLYMAVMNVGTLVGIFSPLLATGYDQRVFIIPAVLCFAGAALLMAGDRTAQIEQRLREAAAQESTVQESLIPAYSSGEQKLIDYHLTPLHFV